MCGHPLKEIVQWILKAWLDLNNEIIIKSFRYFNCQYRMMGVRTMKLSVSDLDDP